MNKLVLLTGSTGFVGKQILSALSERNISVRQIVRRTQFAHATLPIEPTSSITTADMFAESAEWWQSACEDVDTVIHAAWYTEPGEYLYSFKNLDCLKGSLNLAQGAIAAGVRRFVGIGTCLEYDLDQGLLSTTTPLKPLTPYAGAKAACYMALTTSLASAGMEFSWCRLFYLFGDGEDPRRLVPYIRNKLRAGNYADLGSGKQIRDYLDVKDAGEMITKIALSDSAGAHNICSGVPISVRQIAERIADENNNHHLLRFNTDRESTFDPPRIVGVKTE